MRSGRSHLHRTSTYVTRQKGTEPAFTGEYEASETAGTYNCVCCGEPLFRSETKFHSGCGWPSFFAPANGEVLEEETDSSHGDDTDGGAVQPLRKRIWGTC